MKSESVANLDRQVDEIMDNFDFGKVGASMQVLNWRWHFLKSQSDFESRFPTEPELRRTARRLLEDVAKGGDGYFSASGGLYATNVQGVLRLAFEVEGHEGVIEEGE